MSEHSNEQEEPRQEEPVLDYLQLWHHLGAKLRETFHKVEHERVHHVADALACILLERNHWAVTDIEHVFLSITQTFDFRGGSTKLELSIAHKPPLDVVLDLQSEDIVRFSSEERSDVFSRPNAFFEILEVFVLDQKIGEPCFPCDGCQSCNV